VIRKVLATLALLGFVATAPALAVTNYPIPGFSWSDLPQSAPISVAAITTSQVVGVPVASNLQIHVFGFWMTSAGANTVQFVYGTGTNCGTGQGSAGMPGLINAPASTSAVVVMAPFQLFSVPAGNALCVTTTAATSIGGMLDYTVF
jgi:hypothetical protein